jgi:hypothetical protein
MMWKTHGFRAAKIIVLIKKPRAKLRVFYDFYIQK